METFVAFFTPHAKEIEPSKPRAVSTEIGNRVALPRLQRNMTHNT